MVRPVTCRTVKCLDEKLRWPWAACQGRGPRLRPAALGPPASALAAPPLQNLLLLLWALLLPMLLLGGLRWPLEGLLLLGEEPGVVSYPAVSARRAQTAWACWCWCCRCCS
eukprot:scaffold175116_cov13-Tisochrysis_lutea.AAC.1